MGSPEFEALLAATTAERAHADAITSFVTQTKALVKWQHRAEVAEAALARVEQLAREWGLTEFPHEVTADMMRLDLGLILRGMKAAS
jgi:hypothetical protein